MPFEPVDPWVICDLSGRKVRMSETRKTWDNLRVWRKFWYPKHPQLSLRAIPDRMAVKDARPRPSDVWASGANSFCLRSSGGVYWTYIVQDDGSLTAVDTQIGTAQQYLELGDYHLFVDDDGVLYPEASNFPVPTCYTLYSPSNLGYTFVIDDSDPESPILLITPA